ncbi:hypothetical protein ACFQL4_10565 [Halosimplex aquaticum]
MGREKFEVADDFLTIGRTFAEYRRMFDLGAEDLADREILDCGGGAGAFTATAAELAERAVAVDPLYGPPRRTGAGTRRGDRVQRRAAP